MNKHMVAVGNEKEVKYYRRGDRVIVYRWDAHRQRYCPSVWDADGWPGMAEQADEQAVAHRRRNHVPKSSKARE